MKRLEATNTFQEGMVMDFNPLITPNSVMTNCLNGTLLTHNGNENVLLNDMGNGRVETAYLPEGYVPIGTAELGGIIYIVSYNPLKGKCLIGSFPSPKRNFTLDEISTLDSKEVTFSLDEFRDPTTFVIKTPTITKLLGDVILRSGDKFIVCGDSIVKNIDKLNHYLGSYWPVKNFIDFKLATIDNNGRTIYLSGLRKYDTDVENEHVQLNIYHLIKDGKVASNTTIDINDYRDIIGADYQIFTSSIEGGLYIVGQLEVIDSVESINWKLISTSNTPPESVTDEIDSKGSMYYTIEYTIKTNSENNNYVAGFLHGTNDSESHSDIKNNSKSNIILFTRTYQANENSKVNISFTPYMPFGILEYLKQTIHLDFSLLGNNKVTNSIWQYWKDENSVQIKFDINNGFINQNIILVKFVFADLLNSELEKEIELPIKESYSGTNIVIVPFDDKIRENSLFKIEVLYRFSDSNYLDLCTHYLYTNGVFNSKYIENNSEEQNFDKVYLPLEILVKLDQVSNQIPLSIENHLLNKNDKEKYSFVTTTQTTNQVIRGETVYTADGLFPVLPIIGFKNNYNTFSLRECEESIDLKDKGTTVESEVVNEFNVDLEYIKEYTEVKFPEKATIQYDKTTKTIKYDINLVSPISSSTAKKDVTVDNYYTSLISSLDDLYKYGLLADESSNGELKDIKLELSGPALGMSAGGGDNDGTGTLHYVCGTVSIADDTGTNSGLIVSGSANSDFSGSGKAGIFRFPNYDMSKTILDNRPLCGIVPVILANCGTKWLKYGNGPRDYAAFFGGGGANYGHEDGKKVEWFNAQENHANHVTSMLFINIKNTEDFVPIPYFLVSYSESDTRNIDRYYSLLALLYAKRPFEGLVEVYTVSNIGYVNKTVSINKTLTGNVQYSLDNLYFNGWLLSLLFPKNDDPIPNCVKLNNQNNTIKLNELDISFKFDIKNDFLDTYLHYKNSNSVPVYVKSTKSVQPPDYISTSNIYVIDDGKLTSPSSAKISKVKLKLDNNGVYSEDIIGETDDIDISNLDMLMYDERYDTICINRSKINSSLVLKWGSGENSKYTNNTYICSKTLDHGLGVNTLPENE